MSQTFVEDFRQLLSQRLSLVLRRRNSIRYWLTYALSGDSVRYPPSRVTDALAIDDVSYRVGAQQFRRGTFRMHKRENRLAGCKVLVDLARLFPSMPASNQQEQIG